MLNINIAIRLEFQLMRPETLQEPFNHDDWSPTICPWVSFMMNFSKTRIKMKSKMAQFLKKKSGRLEEEIMWNPRVNVFPFSPMHDHKNTCHLFLPCHQSLAKLLQLCKCCETSTLVITIKFKPALFKRFKNVRSNYTIMRSLMCRIRTGKKLCLQQGIILFMRSVWYIFNVVFRKD